MSSQRAPPSSSFGSRPGTGSSAGGGKKPPPRAWGNAASPSLASSNLPNGAAPSGSASSAPWRSAAASTPGASAPNGVGKAQTDEQRMMEAMHDRMVWLMTNLIGTKLVVHLKSGPPLTGILSSASTDSELCLTLSRAYPVPSLTPSSSTCPATPPPPSHPDEVKRSVIIIGKDLVDIEAIGLDWDDRARQDANFGSSVSGRSLAGDGRFRTDAETTGASSTREKTLQSWTSEDGGPGGGLEESDDLEAALFPSNTKSPSGAQNRTFSKPWDQFEENEKLFGLKTDFDEELYTTKLDRSGKDFKERERQAEKLAREILSGSGKAGDMNAHVREERGFLDDSGLNEEDKYGAVVRGEGAYVPPGARKAAAAAAAAKAAATAPSPSTAPNGFKSPEPSPSIPTITTSAADAPAQATDNNAEKPLISSAMSPSQVLAGRKEAAAPSAALAKDESVQAASTSSQHATPSATACAMPASSSEAADKFRAFVSSEKERAIAQKQAMVKRENDKRLADFKLFSQQFKLHMAVPRDMVPLLAKDAAKQEEILARKPEPLPPKVPTPSTPSLSTAGKGPAATAAVHDLDKVKEWQARTMAAANADLKRAIKIAAIPAFKPRTQTPATPEGTAAVSASATPATTQTSIATPQGTPSTSAVASPSLGGQKTPVPLRFGIREIPPYKPKAETEVKEGEPAQTSTGTKLSSKAAAFNPAAKTFTPHAPASSAASSQPASTDTAAPNPFFGQKPPKKGSSSMHVKEDFTPFKAGNVPPDPASVLPTWPSASNRSYKAIFGMHTPGHHPHQHPHHQHQHHHSQHHFPQQGHPGMVGPMNPMHMPHGGPDDDPNMPTPGGFGPGGMPPQGLPPQGFGMYPYPGGGGGGAGGGMPYRGGFPNGPGGPQHMAQMGPMQVNGANGHGGAGGMNPFNAAAAAALAGQMGFMGGPHPQGMPGQGGPPGGGPPGAQGPGGQPGQPVYGQQMSHVGPPHGGQPQMFQPGMFPGHPGRGPPMQQGMLGGPNAQMYGYQQGMPHHFGGPPDGRMPQQMHGPVPPNAPMRYEQ